MKMCEASKIVGWENQSVPYPTLSQVKKAFRDNDKVSLIKWVRFLPSPQNKRQIAVINYVSRCIAQLRLKSDI